MRSLPTLTIVLLSALSLGCPEGGEVAQAPVPPPLPAQPTVQAPASSPDPGPSDPGPSEPGPSDPGPSELGPDDPDTSDPGRSDPDTSDPGASDPNREPSPREGSGSPEGSPAEPAASPEPADPVGSPSQPEGPAQPEGPERPVSEGGVTRFPHLRLFREEKRIEIDGYVNLNQCPTLEFMACTERGKTHESLLRFECDPKHLHLALIMLGLEPTPQVSEQGEPIVLDKGERVVIEVAWWAKHTPEHDDSAPEPVAGVTRWRVEDLIYDQRTQTSMPKVGWVFTGSRMIKVPAPPDWETLKEVYAASYEGNIVATYHHPHVILDTPLAEGGDDTVYVPFTKRVPERGTAVTIHIRPWRKSDGPALNELPKPEEETFGPPRPSEEELRRSQQPEQPREDDEEPAPARDE